MPKDDNKGGGGGAWDKDRQSKKTKEKDGGKKPKPKLSFGKRFRSSIAWASCTSGNKSPDEEKDLHQLHERSQAADSHIVVGKDAWTKLVDKAHNPHSTEYGTVEEQKQLLDEILGPASEGVDLDMMMDEVLGFPQERGKTLAALLLLIFAFVLNTISLVLTHERMQFGRNPLPDTFLDNVPTVDNALYVGEAFLIVSSLATLTMMSFHKYRWIVFRRCFTILSLLYLMRAVTMYVTVLPVASYTYHCDPKMNSSSFVEGTLRVLKLISGFGLSINGQHTFCGDYIFSGHTVILVLAYLFISEYSPRHNIYWQAAHWTQFCVSLCGVILVMVARGHYTIDVLIAYYITTRTFWIYHTLATRQELKTDSSENNYLSRVLWYRYFYWLERNVGGVLPREYSLPFASFFADEEEEDEFE